jgi:hypothetical protein
LKKGPGKQTCVGPRSPQTSAPIESAKNAVAEVAAREPARCSFGATRVGALLGRVRLHLQTDRFLAVHRGDAVWEAGCLEAALALAEIVSRMRAREMEAPLPSSKRKKRRELCGRAKAYPVGDFCAKNALFAPDNTKTAEQRGVRQSLDATHPALERAAR